MRTCVYAYAQVAITPFEALCSFQPAYSITTHCRATPELIALVGEGYAHMHMCMHMHAYAHCALCTCMHMRTAYA